MTSHLHEADEHRALLRQPFSVSYSLAELTPDERSLLHRHGTWLNALEQGELLPTTIEQSNFVLVTRGERAGVTPHETMWLKYCEARSRQTEHLRTLLRGGLLSYDQLEQIRANANDFTFSKEDRAVLIRQFDAAKDTRARGGGAFVVYASTDGQD